MTETNVDGNGHKPEPPPGYEKFTSALNSLDIIDRSFQTQEVANGIKILAVPGDDVSELPMRADFPDRPFLIACAVELTKRREFHDVEGEKELLFIVAGLCGIQGKRAEMLVSAIIGERQNKRWSGSNGWDKFKKAAHLGGNTDE